MDTFHDYITATHKKNPIEAADWSRMRKYYDMFLRYSKDCLELLWLTDVKHHSFAEEVDNEISKDGQKMLGNIKNFKEFVVLMGYDYYLLKCYRSVKNICRRVNTYIKKGKVLTTVGTIRPLPISNNGRDMYIIKRKIKKLAKLYQNYSYYT